MVGTTTNVPFSVISIPVLYCSAILASVMVTLYVPTKIGSGFVFSLYSALFPPVTNWFIIWSATYYVQNVLPFETPWSAFVTLVYSDRNCLLWLWDCKCCISGCVGVALSTTVYIIGFSTFLDFVGLLQLVLPTPSDGIWSTTTIDIQGYGTIWSTKHFTLVLVPVKVIYRCSVSLLSMLLSKYNHVHPSLWHCTPIKGL